MYLLRFCKSCHSLSRTKNLRSLCNNEVGRSRSIVFKPKVYNNVQVCNTIYKSPYFKVENLGLFLKRSFHLSSSNRALPPIVWVVLRSLLRVVAIITGRGLRKWWTNLPKNKRSYILNAIKRNKQSIMIGCALFSGVVYAYYIMHLVEDPITKKKKFLIFSEKQVIQMGMIECEVVLENYKGRIIRSGYNYNKVLSIADQLLRANKHLPGTNKNWQVFIVNDIETKNAFVLPSGHIFIFTGMLAVVSNTDQLAAIIAHEMAHALLNHSAEIASKTHLLEMLMLLPLVALWTVFPGSIALFSHYVTEYASAVLFQLPFSRSLESEADTVGLEMISRACYNPQEASLFWKNMDKFSEDDQVEWLSTHPSHHTRYEMMDELMPKALKIVASHCTRQFMDPRT